MKNVSLDFNIVLMSIAHCQIKLASEGIACTLLILSYVGNVFACGEARHCSLLSCSPITDRGQLTKPLGSCMEFFFFEFT